MSLDDLPAVTIDFEATPTLLGTPRAGAIKSWTLANGIIPPLGHTPATADLFLDLITSTDPGPVVINTGSTPHYIEIPVPPSAGVSSHLFRLSYDPVVLGGLLNWKVMWEDIDGPVTSREEVCYEDDQFDCTRVLDAGDGGRLIVTPGVPTPTSTCVSGQDDAGNNDIEHTLATISVEMPTESIEFTCRVTSSTGGSGIRQFFPRQWVEGTALSDPCDGLYSTIYRILDCDTQTLEFYDDAGDLLDPALFTVVPDANCGL